MNSEIIRMLALAAIVVYGVYLVYGSIRKFIVCSKARKQHLLEKRKNTELIRDYAIWVLAYGIVVAIAIFGIVYEVNHKQDLLMIAAYGFLIMYILSFYIEFITRRIIIFDDDGFFYEETYYRYRSINGVDPVKGIIKRYEIRLTTSADKLQIPHKFGELVKEHFNAYRKKRKSRR